jgi:inner membrane protein
MDNVTHTIAGALLAEAAARFVPPDRLPEPARRRVLYFLLVAGNNLPDLDFLYAGVTAGKLGYLLHHRGHTHTIAGALGCSLLLLAIAWLWLRSPPPRRGEGRGGGLSPLGKRDLRLLLLAALAGPLLHLVMDFQNEYGVHPFWPVDDRWFYGDSVFILEPLFWICAAPLLFLVRAHAGRAFFALVLATGVVLTWSVGIVPPPNAAVLTATLLLLLLLGWRASPRTALLASLAVWLGVTALFVVAARAARARLARHVPHAIDASSAPLPANPFCWSVSTITREGDRLAVRRGLLALAPALVPASACPRRGTSPTAPLSAIASTDDLLWDGEIVLDRRELARLAREHCHVAAFLRFARTPWLWYRDDALLVGDLRYDREPDLGFTEMELPVAPGECPANVPPWVPPRLDVLE